MTTLQAKLFFVNDSFSSIGDGNSNVSSIQGNLSFLHCPTVPLVEDFIRSLRNCRSQEDLGLTKIVHLHACRNGLDAIGTVANCLVPTFVECGGLSWAQRVFYKLADADEFACRSLVHGLVKAGAIHKAIQIFSQIQEQGVPFSNSTHILLLRACTHPSCLEFGKLLHETIKTSGSQEDYHVINALVNMYAKCGSLTEAVKVFETMNEPDIETWASLISGFSKHGKGEDVLLQLRQMELAGLPPDSHCLVYGVKACACIGNLCMGHQLHTDAVRKGFESDCFLGNSLVDMYSKCHSFVEAQKVLNELPLQTSVSWNALMFGYLDNCRPSEAMACYDNMQKLGICPDTATYCCALKAWSSCVTVSKAHLIHSEIVSRGFEGYVVVGTALVDMYAKSGHLHDMYAVFCSLPVRNTVTWNALIAGYAEQGFCEEALECVHKMHLEGIVCDSITYTSCLKAASKAQDIDLAEAVHSMIDAQAFKKDPVVGSSLVDTYVKCGSVLAAQRVFDTIPMRDIISWTALMRGYIEYNCNEKALTCFHEMQVEGVVPNSITYLCLLRACGDSGQLDDCHTAHTEVIKKGYDEEAVIGNSLVYLYINCDCLSQAWDVFDKLKMKNVVSWNTLIFGLVESGYCAEALELMKQMQHEGIFCDAMTFHFSLNACNNFRAPQMGMEIHAEIAKEGLENKLLLGNSLVDFYVNYGLLSEAKDVFNSLPVKDVVLWTALIAGFAEKGSGEDAWSLLESMKEDGVAPDFVFWNAVIAGFASKGDFEKSLLCFFQMQEQGMLPDSITYMNILSVCGHVASLEFGKKLHVCVQKPTPQVMQEGLLTSLIEFYFNCGHGNYAKALYDETGAKSLVAWNALIAGFAHFGQNKQVFNLFRNRCHKWHPDELSFLSVLNACCHSGLLIEGLDCFETIGTVSPLCFTYDHCNCIIDLLARTGHLMETFTAVESLPFEPDIVTWTIVLGACQKWGNVLLRREVFDHALSLQNKYATGTFVMMSNTYSDY